MQTFLFQPQYFPFIRSLYKQIAELSLPELFLLRSQISNPQITIQNHLFYGFLFFWMVQTRDLYVIHYIFIFQHLQQFYQLHFVKMKNSPTKSDPDSVSSFVDKLISPTSLQYPLRKSSSQKNINEANDTTPPPLQNFGLNKGQLLTPIKHRSKSDEKSSQIFTNSKIYGELFQGPPSAILSRISELSQNPFPSNSKKEVRFKQSIIHKNQHKRRENVSRARTPSILKKSKILRQNALQEMQTVNPSQLQKQSALTILSGEDRQTRAAKTNQVVRKRYFTILERFQAKYGSKLKKGYKMRNDEKYKDQLFPPIVSSLFRGGAARNQETRLGDIKWVRLPDIFKNRKIAILPAAASNIEINCNRWRSCNNFIGNAFCCIKNCRQLLDKMFQYREQSFFGIYLVKIFQENVWKYVIIDDYIPTYVDQEGNFVPIFLTVSQLSHNNENPIQIWPFLLQKAYANYYANYESLHYGNTLDFLQEITGTASQAFQPSNRPNLMKHTIKRLAGYLQRQNIIAVGHKERQNVYIPLYRNQYNLLVSRSASEAAAEEVFINTEKIFDLFDKVHVLLPNKWSYSAVSTVGINIRRVPQEQPRFDISLRILKIPEACQVNLSIRQKEKRFYQNSSLNYSYIWNRVIILQKQFQGDFRWHSARYSCSKTIGISEYFEAGEYYILLLPEWKCSHCYQLSLLVQSTSPVSISRKDYNDKQRILEKGCADLSQRFGRMSQINLYACSYTIVQDEIGFIIENINNERFSGDIRINRSIGGIKSKVELVPFNVEFYQPKANNGPFRTQICVYVPADNSYTVILMTRGGLDPVLLKHFDISK